MATNALRILLSFLGTAAVAIATSIILFGVSGTGGFFESLYNALSSNPAPLTGRYSPAAESELRFYAAFWLAYGVLALIAAQEIKTRAHWVPWIALVFFIGGCGRLISYFVDGAPHPFFVLLMIIELALPFLMAWFWLLARKTD